MIERLRTWWRWRRALSEVRALGRDLRRLGVLPDRTKVRRPPRWEPQDLVVDGATLCSHDDAHRELYRDDGALVWRAGLRRHPVAGVAEFRRDEDGVEYAACEAWLRRLPPSEQQRVAFRLWLDATADE